jgi:gliding motility-associated-like protein
MIKFPKFLTAFFLFAFSALSGNGQQFRLQGSAAQTAAGVYRITADATGQAGMVTNYYSLDLTSSFTLNFQLSFGTKDDAGADGMAFMFSRSCSPVLAVGGGLGVRGIPNSLIVEFDTYFNGLPDDIASDHTAIYANGNMTNAGLIMDAQTTPVCLTDICPNVEDGLWHNIQLQWEYLTPVSQRITLYYDGQLRGSSTRNHITDEFANSTMVYWSVAGSTGALSNLQQMKVTAYTNTFTYCEGAAFTLSAPSNGTGYSWTSNGSTSNTASYTATASGTYTCSYTNNCGQAESVSFVINVPVIATPVLLSNNNACIGSDAVFTISSIPGYHIQYTLNSGPVQELIVNTTGTATITIPAITADQTLQLLQVNDGACGKDISVVSTVLVRPIPVVMATGGALCSGTSLQLTASPAGGSWAGTHISSSGLFNAATAAPGMHTVQYNYSNQWGCNNHAGAQVEVYALPVVQTGDGVVCSGSFVQLQATPAGGNWSGTYISSTGVFNATGLAAGIYPVSYSYTDIHTCSNLSSASVTVNPLPVLGIPDAVVCRGSGVQLTATPAGGSWTGGPVSANGIFDATGLTPGNYSVQYNYTDVNGCRAAGTGNVLVYTDQIIPLIIADAPVCEGADAHFRLTGIPGSLITCSINGGPQIRITLDATGQSLIAITGISASQQLLISQVEAGPCIKNTSLQATVPVKLKKWVSISREICEGEFVEGYGVAGTYTDIFTGVNGCDSTRVLQLSIKVYPKPALGPDQVFCEGDTLRLTPGSFSSYLWSTGETTPAIEVSRLGQYWVSTNTVCGLKTDMIEIKPGLCDIYFPSAFTPNGDGKNDLFKPETNLHPADFNMKLYNRWGQLVFTTSDIRTGWDGMMGGRRVDNGVFVYQATYVIRGTRKTVRGMVTLIH